MRLHSPWVFVSLFLVTALIIAILAPNMPVNAGFRHLAASLAAPLMPSSTATATMTATATASPTHTASPSPTATARPSATPTATPSPTPTRAPITSRAIFVDQDAQLMHVFENGVAIKTLPCSTGTGKPGEVTPAWTGLVGRYVGTFYAFDAFADHAWFLFRSAGNILIHSAPYVWKDGKKVYQDLDALGKRPTSHGCIRLAPEDAEWLTKWNPQGVPIAITQRTKK